MATDVICTRHGMTQVLHPKSAVCQLCFAQDALAMADGSHLHAIDCTSQDVAGSDQVDARCPDCGAHLGRMRVIAAALGRVGPLVVGK